MRKNPDAVPKSWSAAIQDAKGMLTAALAFSAAANILYLAPSIYMMQIYDRVLKSGALATLAFLSLILLAALFTLSFVDSMRARLMVRVGFSLDRRLAPLLLEAAQRADGPDSLGADSLRIRQSTRALDSLRQALTGGAAAAIMDAPWSVIYIGVCFLIHPLLGVTTLVGALVLLALAVQNEMVLRNDLRAMNETTPQIYAAQDADLTFSEALRALGMRGALTRRHLAARDVLKQTQARAQFHAAYFSSATRFIRLCLQSIILGVGAFLAIEKQISPGALIACSIIGTRALAPVEQIVGAWRQIEEARSAKQTILKALQFSPELGHPRMHFPSPRGALKLENVHYRHPGADGAVLTDISLSIRPGEVIGVVGPSGAGKSTLARIAAGAVQPNLGAIRLDNVNIADWDPDALGAHIGYLPQEIALLAGSVSENIRRFQMRDAANAPALDAQIIAAAKQADAHALIAKLPGAYDAPLGHGGQGISLGQSQRIALARALYRDPALLILDEPNAHLDQEGEQALMHAIQRAKKRGAAILLIAHRPGVLALADRLAVLQDGRLAAVGPRESILEQFSSQKRQATPQMAESQT
jgi:PrtD family type I secretion system ABC transporter